MMINNENQLTGQFLSHLLEDPDTYQFFINRGTYGDVYQIINNGQKYALKEIKLSRPIVETKRSMAQYEVMVMKRVNQITTKENDNCYNFPQLLDYRWLDKDEHLVLQILMNYIDGQELFELVATKQWKHIEPTVKNRIIQEICQKILELVKVLHSNGIIHRDIKLENVYIDYNWQHHRINHLYLIDFGLACLEDNVTDPDIKDYHIQCPKRLVGTGYYISPVIARKISNRNDIFEGYTYEDLKHSDIWSIGIIMYVMLYNQYPFNHSSIKLLLQQIVKYQETLVYPYHNPFLTPLIKMILTDNTETLTSFELITKLIEQFQS